MDNQSTYTYKKYEDNKLFIQIVALGGLAVLFFILQILTHFSGKYLLVFFVLFVLLVNVLDAYVTGLRRRNYLTWGRGAGAEWVIGKELDRLPFDYELLPDFQTGHGNIDHICIGKTGIFIIEVKAHKGVVTNAGNKVLVNGTHPEKDFISQTKAEMLFLQNLLKEKIGKFYPITSLLVFPHAKILIRRPVDGIWVGGRNFCDWVIKNKPNNSLNDSEVGLILNSLNSL